MTSTTTTTTTAQQQPAAGQNDQHQPPPVNGAAASPEAGPSGQSEERLVLRLRPRRKKGVRWTNDTVDNENMGKKKSKKCCIFHKQRRFGDWSDSDDSDSEGSSGSDGGGDHCEQCERKPPDGSGDARAT